MVGYGKSLVKARRPQWEAAYLDYHHLKEILTKIENTLESQQSFRLVERLSFQNLVDLEGQGEQGEGPPTMTTIPPPPPSSITPRTPQTRQETVNSLKAEFFVSLGLEIEKMSLFTLKEQGKLADAVGSLRFGGNENNEDGDSFEVPGVFNRPSLPSFSSIMEKDHETSDGSTTEDDTKLRLYSMAAVEMVHLLRFICINSIGIQKILKKYNKVFERLDEPHFYMIGGAGNTTGTGNNQQQQLQHHHLEQLAHSESIVALQSSLQTALVEQFRRPDLFDTKESALSYYRFQCVMECSYSLRKNAALLQRPFFDFLSRQSMIITGVNFGGLGGEHSTHTTKDSNSSSGQGQGQRMIQWLFQLKPDAMLSMNEKNLQRLWNWNRWMGGTAGGGFGGNSAIQFHPLVLSSSDDGDSGEGLTPSLLPRHHRRLSTIGEPTLGEEAWDDIMAVVEGGAGGIGGDGGGGGGGPQHLAWGGVNSTTMLLNLLSTLLYTINYYIIAPTANHYAIKLGSDGAFGATLIGASSFSAIFAAFLYSLWYTKSSFQSALIFSTVCPLIGNLVYALAISFDSMPMAIGGRILCGFGSAEVVNRQLISSCVDFEGMTQASALFVAAGAVGMSLGPLLAGILDILCGRDTEVDWPLPFPTPAGGIIWDHVTSPGFVMTGLWSVQLIALVFFFQEPIRVNSSSESSKHDTSATYSEHSDDGPPMWLQHIDSEASRKSTGSDSSHEDEYISEGTPLKAALNVSAKNQGGVWHEYVTTIQLIFYNPGLPVTLLIFSFIELADEVIISSCSMVVNRYFGWPGAVPGFLIASLGALVLPAHFVVEKASRHYSERKILLQSIFAIVLCLGGILNYTGLYYDIMGYFLKVTTPDDEGIEDVNVVIDGHKAKHLLTPTHEFAYDWGLGPYVYMIFMSAAFMGTIVLEGVDTSIMAKVTPPELNDRFINSGLLATLIGTLGRVVGDSMITVSALLDIHIFVDFVNATFLPLLALAIGGIYLVKANYKGLV